MGILYLCLELSVMEVVLWAQAGAQACGLQCCGDPSSDIESWYPAWCTLDKGSRICMGEHGRGKRPSSNARLVCSRSLTMNTPSFSMMASNPWPPLTPTLPTLPTLLGLCRRTTLLWWAGPSRSSWDMGAEGGKYRYQLDVHKNFRVRQEIQGRPWILPQS